MTYNAGSEEELASVYRTIRDRILREYRVVYRALVAPSDQRRVRAVFKGEQSSVSAEQVYYSSTIFGHPAERFGFLYLIPFFAGLALWWLVTLLRFNNRRTDANLEVLSGKTQTYPLGNGQTVIGPSESADVTIAGAGRLGNTGGAGEATVQFDENTGNYTVVAPGEIRVNNQLTKRRRLEPGDVLNIDGTIIVFDKGEK